MGIHSYLIIQHVKVRKKYFFYIVLLTQGHKAWTTQGNLAIDIQVNIIWDIDTHITRFSQRYISGSNDRSTRVKRHHNRGKCIISDTNECDMGGHGCQQLCYNDIGSYSCSCRTGYTLSSDKKTCRGKKEWIYLLIAADIEKKTLTSQVNSPLDIHVDIIHDIDNHGIQCRQRCISASSDSSTRMRPHHKWSICIVSDINECVTDEHRCAQECQNVLGSYKCSCADGYKLSSDNTACEGKKEGIFLLLLT